jgi:hypothetical protein
MERMVQNCFNRERERETWQSNGALRRGDFLRNCRWLIWITFVIQQYTYRLRLTISWRWREEIKHWSMARQRLLLALRICLIARKRHNSFPRCCCSLIVRINILTHLDASFMGPGLAFNFETVMVRFLGSGYISSVSSWAFCFRISTRSSLRSWSYELRTQRHLQYCTHEFARLA